MSHGVITASYIGATILFILALGGLSNQETARRGNIYGIVGMTLALIATMSMVTGNLVIMVLGLLVGGGIGFVLAKRVQMTEMPELVAILHSLVGLAAVLVGLARRGARRPGQWPLRPAPRSGAPDGGRAPAGR